MPFSNNCLLKWIVALASLTVNEPSFASTSRAASEAESMVTLATPVEVTDDKTGESLIVEPGSSLLLKRVLGAAYEFKIRNVDGEELSGDYTVNASVLNQQAVALIERGARVQSRNASGGVVDCTAKNLAEPAAREVSADYENASGNMLAQLDTVTAKTKLSDEIKKDNKICQKPKGCDAVPLKTKEPLRKKYDAFIIEAANTYGISPALLKAQLHAETSMNSLLENEGEKSAIAEGGGNKTYKWGKGLGQFGASNAADYGLNWNAPMPKVNAEFYNPKSALNQPGKNGLFSIWSPRGAILAKAKMLKQRYDTKYEMQISDKNGTKKKIRIDVLYKRNEVETARYLAGMYNRGVLPINSIREYYRQNGVFPRYYAEAWKTSRHKDSPSSPLLAGEKINLCHVYKIAGLCGEEAQGYYAEYAKDFKKSTTGAWARE